MRAPTTAALLMALVALFVAPDGATAAVHNYKNGYPHGEHKHHQGHHQGHHQALHHNQDHQDHQGLHGPRAARTRREEMETGTAYPDIGQIKCTVGGNECAEVVNSECNLGTLQCFCPVAFPVHDYENKYCVNEAKLNRTCQFNSECEEGDPYAVCGGSRLCVCRSGYKMDEFPNVGLSCVEDGNSNSSVDPAMIGVLAGLALMFVIICVVLRLFSKARFRENRSIFNTPNPRLMNASLFKDSKLLPSARGERRGSRAPSRAPSVTSVNAATRSPNGSLAKVGVSGRRGSTMSAVSATGSQAGARTPSPNKKKSTETTVAIETVD